MTTQHPGEIMISDIIKQLRTAAGMSRSQLAAALDVVEPTVARWERGTQPSLVHQKVMAEYFDAWEAFGLTPTTEHRPAWVDEITAAIGVAIADVKRLQQRIDDLEHQLLEHPDE